MRKYRLAICRLTRLSFGTTEKSEKDKQSRKKQKIECARNFFAENFSLFYFLNKRFCTGKKEFDLFGSVVRLFKFGTVPLCKKFAVAIEHQAGDGGLHGAVKFFVKLHDRTCRNLRVGGVDIINRMQNF